MKQMTGRTAKAWRIFQDHVTAQGGTVLEDGWLGAREPHRVRCAAGHECAPRPNNVARQGLCRVCGGRDSATAEAAFRATLAAQGATLLEDGWLGKDTPHRVRCAAGHECAPCPGSLRRGTGVCRVCAGRAWDVFYVVTGPDGLKFGITSGDPRPRLVDHRRDGYTDVVRLHTGLAGTSALDLETELKRLLKALDVLPVRGREYFPASVLRPVLAVVDEWLD
jgi:hypothetical protein